MPTNQDREIIVTPHEIITIEAKPPVTSDEIAFYCGYMAAPKQRTWSEFIWGGIAIALGALTAFVFLSPIVRAAVSFFTGGLP